jgi:DNA-binding transcriptional MerR regulator
MHLKVGELAKRSGLTVRALHHYDSIGLLSPSARTDAGYRLYHRDDVARLHQIQALRRFGVALADIGTFLADPGCRLPAIVDQQIAALTRQIEQAGALRDQLTRLKRQLDADEEPALADWLTTLELMTMYDKYFTKEQRERLPFFNGGQQCIAEWDAIVAQMHAFKDSGTAPEAPQVQRAARNWMTMLERDTGGDAQQLVRVNAMQDREPAMRARNGITPELGAYVMQSFGSWRLGLYQKYLTDEEFAFMKANYPKRAHEWSPLIARVSAHMETGAAPSDPASRLLAREWMELFSSYAGRDPATHLKIREAHAKEPGLMTGTFVSDALLAFIRAAATA